MEHFESEIGVEQSIELLKARIARRKTITAKSRVRRSVELSDSPTKALDAVMLGDALVGYGNNMSQSNMVIMENLLTMATMEADALFSKTGSPQQWYEEFMACMKQFGCFPAVEGHTQYSESSRQVSMDIVISDIVKGIIDGVKASNPAAAVLGTVAATTIEGLKTDEKTIKLFNRQAKKYEGARLSIIPCEQLASGSLVASAALIRQTGSTSNGGVLFVNWQSSAREIFHGKAFLTFEPSRYERVGPIVEEYLDEYRKELLKQRFNRRKRG